MGQKWGYARVSAAEQKFETQIEALLNEGVPESNIFKEKVSGKKLERDELQKVLKKMKEGDTLVVTRLDRLARSSLDAMTTVRDLFERGIRIHILNLGVVDSSPTGKLIFTMFAAFAQFERDLITDRLREGREFARQQKGDDYREGRPPKFGRKQKAHAMELLDQYTQKEVVALTGMSLSTVQRAAREKRAREIKRNDILRPWGKSD